MSTLPLPAMATCCTSGASRLSRESGCCWGAASMSAIVSIRGILPALSHLVPADSSNHRHAFAVEMHDLLAEHACPCAAGARGTCVLDCICSAAQCSKTAQVAFLPDRHHLLSPVPAEVTCSLELGAAAPAGCTPCGLTDLPVLLRMDALQLALCAAAAAGWPAPLQPHRLPRALLQGLPAALLWALLQLLAAPSATLPRNLQHRGLVLSHQGGELTSYCCGTLQIGVACCKSILESHNLGL